MKNHLIEGDPINSGVIARVPFRLQVDGWGAHAIDFSEYLTSISDPVMS